MYLRQRYISQTAIAEKLNVGLASVSEIILSFGYMEVCTQWVLHHLLPEIQTARQEACWLLLTLYAIRVMIFYTLLSQGQELGASLQPGIEKPVTLLLPETKKFQTQPSTGKCMLTFFWDYRGTITRSTWSKVQKSTSRLT
jgi:hypothetical protein